MEQYIARELKEDIKYLIKRITELNEKIEKMKEHKEQFKRKENQLRWSTIQ